MNVEAVQAEVLAQLAGGGNTADAEPAWPGTSWELARQLGALQWCIPTAYGGQGLAGVPLLERYEELASACLTTCFILSQRDAACRRLRDSGHERLCTELLPPLARGETFATVGLSQLTTSGQHRQPSLRVTTSGEDFVLDGMVPWVTGAARAGHLVIGGVIEDGRQVLLVLDARLPGVSIGLPLDLMALEGSMTAEVRCDHVRVERRWLLGGPAERVLVTGKGGSGGLETSCLGLGLAAAAVAHLRHESQARTELRTTVDRLEQHRQRLRHEMHELAGEGARPEAMVALRGRVNSFVLRATQAALTASKGTGFLRRHPAQRWARQAMFFLVWSCPRPAMDATLEYLSGFCPSDE